jgi:alcohol sulfotransferase
MMSALRRLDLWYRARRRQRKIMWRLRHADAVVVTHTKSGRTWLLVMISYLFHLKYGTPASEIIKFDNLHRRDARIPKLYFTRWANLLAPDDARGPPPVDPATRFVFLFRDPRDVAVSYYFHLQNRSTPVERAHKAIADAVLTKPMFDFVVDDAVGLPQIVRLMNRWVERMTGLERAILVRYEDLHATPAAELGRVMAFIGAPCSPEELEEAVEFATFENLKDKETARFFGSERLRPTDSADPDAFKVRRGKVGGYRDYFDDAQLSVIDTIVETQLSPRLGYRGAPHLARPDPPGRQAARRKPSTGAGAISSARGPFPDR